MKNVVLILAALFVSACSVEPVAIEGHDAVLFCEMEDGCEGWDLEVAVAFDRYAARYKLAFNEEPVLPLTVTVRDHIWGGVDWAALDGGRVLGYTNGRDIVVVGRDLDTLEPKNPQNEELFHEITHSVLDSRYGDGDGDHVEGEGPWTSEHDNLIGILVHNLDNVGI